MTDEQNEQSGEANEAQEAGDKRLEADAGRIDILLRSFAYITTVNRVEGVPVTLNVGGLLVTGILISRETYVQQMVSEMRALFAHTTEEVRDFMEQTLFAPLSKPVDPEAEAPPLSMIEYIHLKDARIFNGGVPIPSQEVPGLLWRGRLSAVDGFSFGRLESARKESI